MIVPLRVTKQVLLCLVATWSAAVAARPGDHDIQYDQGTPSSISHENAQHLGWISSENEDATRGSMSSLPHWNDNSYFYQPPDWLDQTDFHGSSSTLDDTSSLQAAHPSQISSSTSSKTSRNRALGLARRKLFNNKLQEEEWEMFKVSNTAEANAIIARSKERIRDSTLRCRLRKRLQSNPNDGRAIRTLMDKGWTLADLELTRHVEPYDIKMSHERREAVKKQITLLRCDIKAFKQSQKVMSTSYYDRQRQYKAREKDVGKEEDATRAEADRLAEEMVQKVKDTRYIFRKSPSDPRLIGLFDEINKWMEINIGSRYQRLALPSISLLPITRSAHAGSSGLASNMSGLDIGDNSACEPHLEPEQVLTQIFGDDEGEEERTSHYNNDTNYSDM